MKAAPIFSRRWISVRFVFAIVIMLIATGLIAMTIYRIGKADDYRVQTYRVLIALEHVFDSLLNVETSARGFALAGTTEYLKPYEAGRRAIEAEVAVLRQLTADNPTQQRRLDGLDPLVRERIDLAGQLVQARAAGGLPAAAAFVVGGEGKRSMDQIRRILDEMTQVENNLLAQRDETARREKFWGSLGTTLGLAGALALLVSVFVQFSREHDLRLSVEGDLVIAKERAEAADRLKSAFLATMSHELRTPLNSIIGFTGIILQGLAGPLNPEQAKQLGMVQGSARHLLALINDVLDISKIEAGQLEVSLASFDLRASIATVADTVRPLAERKGLGLAVEVAPGVGTLVSDRRRVEQVLLNLLSNAIKFTEHGSVTLTAAVVPGALPRQPSAIRLAVTDTGMGIKAEDLGGLFRPFRQIDAGLARNHDGSGLGLAICRKLAAKLGGTVVAESEWGRGSTFTFTLPVAVAAE